MGIRRRCPWLAIELALETITLAESGVNGGFEKPRRQRYDAESMIELGSVYETLVKPSLGSHHKQAARYSGPNWKRRWRASRRRSKLQLALKLLADAEVQVPPSKPSIH